MRILWVTTLLFAACDSVSQPIDPALLRPLPPKTAVTVEPGAEREGPPPRAASQPDQNPAEPPEAGVLQTEPAAEPDSSRLQEGLDLMQQGDYRAADPILRQELVDGEGFREAALALASLYQSRESHIDAEAILLAGLSRDPEDFFMCMFHARILSDLNRWEESAAILRELESRHPDRPSLLIALVAAERALVRLDEADEVLNRLLSDFADDSLVMARRSELDSLAEDLAEERKQGDRLRPTASELFALVRAGETRAIRMKAFKILVARPSTRPRAVLIAYSQDDPILRIQAVRAWPADESDMRDLPENLGILFADPDPRVRAESSALARRLPPPQAADLVLAAMEKETDGYAFRVMHADMIQILQKRLILPPGAEDLPESRKVIVQRWRELWGR